MQRDRDARFSYSITSVPGTVRIQLIGEVDLEVEDQARAALDEAVDAAEGSLVVDLGGLAFLDSTGLRLLIELKERLDGHPPALSLVPGNASVQRVFEVTGVDKSFTFTPRDAATPDTSIETKD
ncbi:MAG: STAS domain-containing protein [Actinomycetota bacterium]|nr:STAS domain-containing protein [Actinomycetota bacterium]